MICAIEGLPSGALITGAEVYVTDNDGSGAISATLVNRPANDYSGAFVSATATTTGTSTSTQILSITADANQRLTGIRSFNIFIEDASTTSRVLRGYTVNYTLG